MQVIGKVEVLEMKETRKRIFLFIGTFFLLICFTLGAVYLKSVADYKRAVKETTIDEIDISNVADGVYIGEYDVNFIYAKVEVTVQNGEILKISILEHRHERGKKAESVIKKIVDEQKIDIDAISGATNSSTVLKKAVANALMNYPSSNN